MLTWTELPDKSGATMTAYNGTWPDLIERIRTVGEFPSKDITEPVTQAEFAHRAKREARNA